LIASKKKSIQILERLSREFESEKPDISNLYTPVGLKTGAPILV